MRIKMYEEPDAGASTGSNIAAGTQSPGFLPGSAQVSQRTGRIRARRSMSERGRKAFRWVLSKTNLALSKLDLQLARTTTAPRSKIEFYRNIREKGFEPTLIVDVGVAHGTPSIYESFPDAKYFLVEPLKEFQPVLEDLTRELDAEYLLAAAGSHNGTVSLQVREYLDTSSALKSAEGEFADGEARTVQMVRLDEVVKVRNGDRIFLKIDVEGTELDALSGAASLLPHVDMIELEVSLIEHRIGSPIFFDVVKYLASIGFVCYEIMNPNYRPLDRALTEVDVVFVREDHFLRRQKEYAAADQRLKLSKKKSQRYKDFA